MLVSFWISFFTADFVLKWTTAEDTTAIVPMMINAKKVIADTQIKAIAFSRFIILETQNCPLMG